MASQDPITITLVGYPPHSGGTRVGLVSCTYWPSLGQHQLVVDAGDGERHYTAHQEPGTPFQIGLDPGTTELQSIHPIFMIQDGTAAAWRELGEQLKLLSVVYYRPYLVAKKGGSQTFLERLALFYFGEVIRTSSTS